jgi:hypothetical protein
MHETGWPRRLLNRALVQNGQTAHCVRSVRGVGSAQHSQRSPVSALQSARSSQRATVSALQSARYSQREEGAVTDGHGSRGDGGTASGAAAATAHGATAHGGTADAVRRCSNSRRRCVFRRRCACMRGAQGREAHEEVLPLLGVSDALATHHRDARAHSHHHIGMVHRLCCAVDTLKRDQLPVPQLVHPPAHTAAVGTRARMRHMHALGQRHPRHATRACAASGMHAQGRTVPRQPTTRTWTETRTRHRACTHVLHAYSRAHRSAAARDARSDSDTYATPRTRSSTRTPVPSK